ncbi:hypothetical protein Sjap_000166 [Stephania japonica]|uniref:Uncharacterized protein n=1 Tax=Stephania japonica TaxID=461633 RepID=A0AAP0KHH6_9MAGN
MVASGLVLRLKTPLLHIGGHLRPVGSSKDHLRSASTGDDIPVMPKSPVSGAPRWPKTVSVCITVKQKRKRETVEGKLKQSRKREAEVIDESVVPAPVTVRGSSAMEGDGGCWSKEDEQEQPRRERGREVSSPVSVLLRTPLASSEFSQSWTE